MAIPDLLDRGAMIDPEGPCLIMGEERYSYREIQKLTNRIANGLIGLGYGFDRNAGVLCTNDPVGYACTLGIMKACMAYVPMNTFHSRDTMKNLLDFFDVEVLFYQSRFHDMVAGLRPTLPKIELLVCIEQPQDDIPGLMEWIEPFSDAAPGLEIPPEATAWLQSTGGTTGESKAVIMTHRQKHHITNMMLMTTMTDPKPVMLVSAPITHGAGGLSYHVLACGGTLVLLEKPDPQLVLAAIPKYGITRMFLPPTAIYRLLDQPNVRDVDYSSLKCFVCSAAPISTSRLRQAIEVFGPVMAQSYGQTEGIAITFMYPEEHFVDGKIAPDSRLSSAGRPVPLLTKVVIMDDDHRAVPAGRAGEICVRGDGLMKGYYKAPYATSRTIVDGWLHTGDIGFLDEEGYLHIVDRKKDMIISGGFNVYPGEIEQMISSIDGVRDCAVIGVPDDDWGEALKAVVELSSGKVVRGEEIIARCKERLGSVKAPKSVDFIEQLPRSAPGKVLKRELRDMYWMRRERKI